MVNGLYLYMYLIMYSTNVLTLDDVTYVHYTSSYPQQRSYMFDAI